MDRVKEALFSIIGRRIVKANFLDLFSGTGSVGIEALSRGAAQAVMVELDRYAVKNIQENLQITKLGDRAVIRRTDVFSFLKHPTNQTYHYIYIAPPQYQELWLKTLQTLDDNPAWITPETTVIVQIDPKERQDLELQHLEAFDERTYGKTTLWFFQQRQSADVQDE
jgi:16S rRNA (guanine(966)-N(2))-methyltransferase RsmD